MKEINEYEELNEELNNEANLELEDKSLKDLVDSAHQQKITEPSSGFENLEKHLSPEAKEYTLEKEDLETLYTKPFNVNENITIPIKSPRRYFYLVSLIAIVLLGTGVTFFYLKLSAKTQTPEFTASNISQTDSTSANTIADTIAVTNEQLKQVSVEEVKVSSVNVNRETTGKIAFNEDRVTPVFTGYAGRVLDVLANKGDYVEKGSPLFVVESADLVLAHNDLASARSDVAKAKISLDAAQVAVERARRLHAQEALATKDLQQAESDLLRAQDEDKRAKAALSVVENKLALFGKSTKDLPEQGQIDRRITITAPISGTIVDKKIGLGQYLKTDASDPLFLIADMSSLWVWADVYESDLAKIHLNSQVNITVAAYPDRSFPAVVSLISPSVDPNTHTVRVRCSLQNKGGLLKPEMFAKVKINDIEAKNFPVVPASAVISQGNEAVVLVEESPGHFRRQTIQAGQQSNGFVMVEKGLQPGEKVVTQGGLLVNEIGKS